MLTLSLRANTDWDCTDRIDDTGFAKMPLILTQIITNFIPSFDYDDIEGVQYQYPNGYKNMIKPGMKFIYYRGSFGSEGQRRIPEYFGTGMISERSMESAPDVPKSSRSWIAFIDEYKPFDKPIPFKENGSLRAVDKSSSIRSYPRTCRG